MSLASPADAAIEELRRGGQLSSGRVTVGRLGQQAQRLLEVLWAQRGDLSGRKGADQISALRRVYRAAPAPESPAALPAAERPAAPPAPSAPRWRLQRLRCRSIRGIAPLGVDFAFAFEGLPTLVYGPNGSGKSSLLTAISWVLTGRVVTDGDTEDEAQEIPLYAPPTTSGRAAKLCDWPVVHTLPESVPSATTPRDCWAELHLRSADGTRELYLRRTFGGGLQESADGTTWTPCDSLSRHGIAPLDIQLSVSAATVFGRRSLESSDDTRHLLSMMLGYDALEELGALVTTLAANLTKVAKAEREAAQGRSERLRARLATLPGRLRDEHPLRTALASLVGPSLPTPERITEVHGLAAAAVTNAEAALGALLGLAALGVAPGLGDALTTAVGTLEAGWGDLFPRLAALQRSGTSAAGAAANSTEGVAAALRTFEERAAARIRERYAWWTRESAPGSKAGLLMQAAPYFNPEAHACPVCDQSIADSPLEGQLRDLAGASADHRVPLRQFFRDLTEELHRIVPADVLALGAREPAAELRADWQMLRRDLGTALATVVARYDAQVEAIAANLPVPESAVPDLLPGGADTRFVAEAASFVAAAVEAQRGLAVAAWAMAHLPRTGERLTSALLAAGGDSSSLLTALARGKEAAADIAPVAWLRDELAEAVAESGAIRTAEGDLATLEEIKAALESIKPLGKYAESEVARIFDEIREQTLDNYRKLYPNANPVLVPARLHLNKGRNQTVEAYLAAAGFELPGQHVANAGLLRALALAFYFALLNRHPGGLGFVIMDDPILSLDDDHREAWSANILRPALASTQIIVATHQRQFLNHCRADFQPGRLVELNPRTRSRQITYRPGDRLDRAEQLLATAWTSAPNEMRKYREELLVTLDAYSPTAFFSASNLRVSLDTYAALQPPHPLVSSNQKTLARRLREEGVTRVLDPGSHAPTEGDVTEPMVRECLRVMRELDQTFHNELNRLEWLRQRELRVRPVEIAPAPPAPPEAERPPAVLPFERLRVGDDAASWADAIELTIIGVAAAQTHGCVVDLSEPAWTGDFPPGGAVLVADDALAPIARPGQWALLASPEDDVDDGDLVAVIDRTGNRYLRRVWSAGDAWFCEAVNPTAGVGPVRLRKCECLLRKLIGVSYGPRKDLGRTNGRLVTEWLPRQDFSSTHIAGHFGITIEGTSLEPIAADGQVVLVGRKLDGRFDSIKKGSLAVVETEEDHIGSVIKRVFPHDRTWQLVSPNPIEPRDPIPVLKSKIRAIWPVRGILFGVTEREREES